MQPILSLMLRAGIRPLQDEEGNLESSNKKIRKLLNEQDNRVLAPRTNNKTPVRLQAASGKQCSKKYRPRLKQDGRDEATTQRSVSSKMVELKLYHPAKRLKQDGPAETTTQRGVSSKMAELKRQPNEASQARRPS